MEWYKLYEGNNKPTFEQIEKYVNNKIWSNLNEFIKETYNIEPELNYSMCSGKPRMECKI